MLGPGVGLQDREGAPRLNDCIRRRKVSVVRAKIGSRLAGQPAPGAHDFKSLHGEERETAHWRPDTHAGGAQASSLKGFRLAESKSKLEQWTRHLLWLRATLLPRLREWRYKWFLAAQAADVIGGSWRLFDAALRRARPVGHSGTPLSVLLCHGCEHGFLVAQRDDLEGWTSTIDFKSVLLCGSCNTLAHCEMEVRAFSAGRAVAIAAALAARKRAVVMRRRWKRARKQRRTATAGMVTSMLPCGSVTQADSCPRGKTDADGTPFEDSNEQGREEDFWTRWMLAASPVGTRPRTLPDSVKRPREPD
jgi:hypothetical protein